jgi:hypothetical protein
MVVFDHVEVVRPRDHVSDVRVKPAEDGISVDPHYEVKATIEQLRDRPHAMPSWMALECNGIVHKECVTCFRAEWRRLIAA